MANVMRFGGGGGKPEQTKTVELSMASGDQVITPDTGKVLTQVTVKKPSTLRSENISAGVKIGGVTGSANVINVAYVTITNPTNYDAYVFYAGDRPLNGITPDSVYAVISAGSSLIIQNQPVGIPLFILPAPDMYGQVNFTASLAENYDSSYQKTYIFDASAYWSTTMPLAIRIVGVQSDGIQIGFNLGVLGT